MLRRAPDLIEQFLPTIIRLLLDKNDSILLAAVALVSLVIELNPNLVTRFASLVSPLVKILRRLISATNKEYMINGVANPFLQSRILQLLRVLGRKNSAASEAMSSILTQVASTQNYDRNASNAMLYEAVRTILDVESSSGLQHLATNILGHFLKSEDVNCKYVALSTFASIIKQHPNSVARHRNTIVDCLKDADVSIRTRALELVYSLLSPGTIKPLTRELVVYLGVVEKEQKADLANKIAMYANLHAPDPLWLVQTLLELLSICGDVARGEVLATFVAQVVQLSNASDRAYLVHKTFQVASTALEEKPDVQQTLLQAALWLVGECGDLLLQTPPPAPAEVIESGQLPSLPAAIQTETSLTKFLKKCAALFNVTPETLGFVITAATKLSVRLKSDAAKVELAEILRPLRRHMNLEIQARSNEYAVLAQLGASCPSAAPHTHTILAAMPPPDLDKVQQKLALAVGDVKLGAKVLGSTDKTMDTVTIDPSKAKAMYQASQAAASPPSLLSELDDIFAAPATKAPAAPGVAPAVSTAAGSSAVDLLDDIFGATPAATSAVSAAPSSTAAATLDIFGATSVTPAITTTLAPAPTPAATATADLISDLFQTIPAAATVTPVVPAGPTSIPGASPYEFVAYSSAFGFQIHFKCTKPNGPNTPLTSVFATYSSSMVLTQFVCQVAALKYITLNVLPATDSSVQPDKPVTQEFRLTNSQQGTKALALRLRVEFTLPSGEKKVEQVDVRNFPIGL